MSNPRQGIAQIRKTTGRPTAAELAWQAKALCRETDPETFFPVQGDLAASRAAKRVCSMCEVRAECLLYALVHNETHGIWGGRSDRERRVMRRGESA